MKIILIIPAYDEEENILNTVNSIKEHNLSSQLKYDYLVINDGSTDKTEEVLINNNINHVSLITNLGIGGAVQTGYIYADYQDYDIAVQFDGDGQHDINSVENIVRPVVEGKVDFCLGTRFGEEKSEFQSTFTRRLGINILNKLIAITTGIKITDFTSGLRACNRQVIELFSKTYPVDYPEPESYVTLSNKGFKVGERSVNMFERKMGSSSIKIFDSVYYMIKVSLSIIFEKIVKK